MVEEFPTDSGDRRVARQQQGVGDNPLSIANKQQFAEALMAITVMTQPPAGQGEVGDGAGQLLPGVRLADLPVTLRTALQSREANVANVTRAREGVAAIFSDLIARRTTYDQGANALFGLGRDAIPFLVAGLNSEDFRVREASQAALRRFGPQASETLIATSLDPTCPTELRRRAHTLLTQGGEAALAPLLRNLDSNRHEVRLGALQSIEQLGLTRQALPALFRRMDDPNSSDELREQLEKFIVSSHIGSRFIADDQRRLRYVLDPNNGQLLAAINYRNNEIHSIHINGGPRVRREANGTYSLFSDGNWHNEDGLTTAVSVEFRGEDVLRVRYLNRQGRTRLVQDNILHSW